MGIQNLLRFMKPFVHPVHIKKYSGKRVGIDAYSWLHKGAYSCSMELCLTPGTEASTRYLQYFMHLINMLHHYRVTPVVVLDGGNLPCKAAVEVERQKKRDANLATAKKKLDEGDAKAALEFFQKAVHVTPFMAHQLTEILRSEGIEFVVAPYEADAQLVYLSTVEEKQGGIGAVITEDSDLLAYGCKAIVFKMDRYGNGEEIVLDEVINSASEGLSFHRFDQELFTGMCVLAGCDFLPSIPGIGIKRAHALVSKYKNLDRVLSMMKYQKAHLIPERYFKLFREAVTVFHHARIYDVAAKVVRVMKPLPEKLLQSLENGLDFLGPELSPSVASAIATGRLDPITMEAFDHFSKAKLSSLHISKSTISVHQIKQKVMPMPQNWHDIPFSEQHEADTREVKDPLTFSRICHSKELSALKIISLTEFPHKPEELPQQVHFPKNNPFKKSKSDDSHMKLKTVMSDGSTALCSHAVKSPILENDKDSTGAIDLEEIFSLSGRDQGSEVTEAACEYFSGRISLKKEKADIHRCASGRTGAEQVSVVMDQDNDHIVSPGSEGSVSSKPHKRPRTDRHNDDNKATNGKSSKADRLKHQNKATRNDKFPYIRHTDIYRFFTS